MAMSRSQEKAMFAKKNCNNLVSDKIAINTREFQKGKFVSLKQAKFVSILQVKKKHPNCRVILMK